MVVDAVVLAGGSVKGLSVGDVETKALIEIEGRPMIEYVLDALRNCPQVRKIVVVVPSEKAFGSWTEKADAVEVATGTITENFFAGLRKIDGSGLVLAVTADLPLLTPEAISDFLARCSQRDAEIYYPVMAKEEIEKKFPETTRTYALLKEGHFTGGNIGLLDRETILRNRELLEKFYDLRKSPLKLALAIGPITIIKFLLHRLTISEAEKKFSGLIKARGIAIITPYVEIGIDVDKDSDLELVSRLLA